MSPRNLRSRCGSIAVAFNFYAIVIAYMTDITNTIMLNRKGLKKRLKTTMRTQLMML
jgi:amino acid permease